ncbi:Hypothetical protein EAG7_01631 [Klebsiella aerogenes]|nr:Hypothetical protein EAG7_01631 [Klebsiella aerogenes]CCG30105.1 hypothetical protein [Klebsiella aerogenes EA1509E]
MALFLADHKGSRGALCLVFQSSLFQPLIENRFSTTKFRDLMV